jgi:hypothetical protein
MEEITLSKVEQHTKQVIIGRKESKIDTIFDDCLKYISYSEQLIVDWIGKLI